MRVPDGAFAQKHEAPGTVRFNRAEGGGDRCDHAASRHGHGRPATGSHLRMAKNVEPGPPSLRMLERMARDAAASKLTPVRDLSRSRVSDQGRR